MGILPLSGSDLPCTTQRRIEDKWHMMVLVSYDVAQDEGGKRRLRNVARICQGYGQRVQYSVSSA